MLIGLTGPAKVGKDTVGEMIIKMNPAFVRVSFATPIKIMLMQGLNLVNAQVNGDAKDMVDLRYNCTVRHMMQTLGTEWGRDLIHPDIWLIAVKEYIKDKPFTVITDVRFENEAAFVRMNGTLLHIAGRGGIPGDHESEKQVEYSHVHDFGINNSRTLEHLEVEVEAFMLANAIRKNK